MVSHDASITIKKKGKKQTKNPKSDKDPAVSSEDEQTYGNDHQSIGEPKNDSEK